MNLLSLLINNSIQIIISLETIKITIIIVTEIEIIITTEIVIITIIVTWMPISPTIVIVIRIP